MTGLRSIAYKSEEHKEHITIFLHYNISWNNKPKLLYFSYIYPAHWHCQTDNIMEQQIWPLWQKNKNIGIAI